MQKGISLLLLLFFYQRVAAQILPSEGHELNYRIVGFSFPGRPGDHYQLEIARGNQISEDSFQRSVFKKVMLEKNSAIAEVPLFGTAYTWRTVYIDSRGRRDASALHHFSTGICRAADTSVVRFKILQAATCEKDKYFFLDNSRALFDMDGQPVWYLPASGEYPNYTVDLKLSPLGTITFIAGNNIYETNFEGKVLWKGPVTGKVNGERQEGYHHQFSRLANGNYMVLGIQHVFARKRWTDDGSQRNVVLDSTGAAESDTNFRKSEFGTIVEYDSAGNVVWSWRSLPYFEASDLRYRSSGSADFLAQTHENAFFFDEKNKVVYLSLRGCSRILKIRYPDGKILREYGEHFLPSATSHGNGLYKGQHSCKIARDGSLYLYNNNAGVPGALPQVVVMREPPNDTGTLVATWKYDCSINDIDSAVVKKPNYGMQQFAVGGSVGELPDGSFFVSMSDPLSKVFVVDRDKKVLWAGLPERWDANRNSWIAHANYRACAISRQELEQMVWNK